MKTKKIICLIGILALLFGVVQTSSAMYGSELVIMDFNTGDKPNNLGGDLGA